MSRDEEREAIRSQLQNGIPAFPELPSPAETLAADASGRIHFRTTSPVDLPTLLGKPFGSAHTGRGWLSLPDGASPETPVPAVVVVPGSGGMSRGVAEERAAFLTALGVASFVIDFYGPRGVTPETDYAQALLAVSAFDIVADAYCALRLLSTHPSIDGSRIGLMGFSLGGACVRYALDERIRRALLPEHPGFAGYVDVYGICNSDLGTREVNGAPLLALRGDEDASNNLDAWAHLEESLRTAGVPIESKIYPGAAHGWDLDYPRQSFPTQPYMAGCRTTFDAEGRECFDGTPQPAAGPDASRADRVAVRLQAMAASGSALQFGYTIGRDPAVHERANEDIAGFLRRVLRP